MVERPEPVRDLDWDPKRARAFTDGVADIYEELLTKLRDLPVSGTWGVQEVRDAVVIPVPDDPMPEDELLEYLSKITFDYSGYLGHPRFYAYISGAGTVPGAAADLLASGSTGTQGDGVSRPRRPRSSWDSLAGSHRTCSGCPRPRAERSRPEVRWRTSSR